MNFPLCNLRNTRIVECLPAACPLAERNPADRLTEIKDRSFWDGDEIWSNVVDGGMIRRPLL